MPAPATDVYAEAQRRGLITQAMASRYRNGRTPDATVLARLSREGFDVSFLDGEVLILEPEAEEVATCESLKAS
jgi:transcriptional regulator with XRE-family HTH domain